MNARLIQFAVLAVAVVAFVLAFVTAGAVFLSSLFMLLGLAAVAWLALTLIVRLRRVGRTKREADAAALEPSEQKP